MSSYCRIYFFVLILCSGSWGLLKCVRCAIHGEESVSCTSLYKMVAAWQTTISHLSDPLTIDLVSFTYMKWKWTNRGTKFFLSVIILATLVSFNLFSSFHKFSDSNIFEQNLKAGNLPIFGISICLFIFVHSNIFSCFIFHFLVYFSFWFEINVFENK